MREPLVERDEVPSPAIRVLTTPQNRREGALVECWHAGPAHSPKTRRWLVE